MNGKLDIEISPQARDLLAIIYKPGLSDFLPVHKITWEDYKKRNGIGTSDDIFGLPREEFLTIAAESIPSCYPLDSYGDLYDNEASYRSDLESKGARYFQGNSFLTHPDSYMDHLGLRTHHNTDTIRRVIREELIGLVSLIQRRYYKDIEAPTPITISTRTRALVGVFVSPEIQPIISPCFDDPAEDGKVHVKMPLPPKEYLPVLDFILKDSEKLREKHGDSFNPEYYHTGLSRELGWSVTRTKTALKNLKGLLCESVEFRRKYGYQRRYFLPSIRIDLAKKLI